jgi:hypothetical protein
MKIQFHISKVKKRLRQGDSLSHFLFKLVVDTLSKILKKISKFRLHERSNFFLKD